MQYQQQQQPPQQQQQQQQRNNFQQGNPQPTAAMKNFSFQAQKLGGGGTKRNETTGTANGNLPKKNVNKKILSNLRSQLASTLSNRKL